MDIVYENRIGMDYVQDGVLHRCVNTTSIQLESLMDIDNLPTDYRPGIIAHMPGYTKMWEYTPDGTWASIL